MSEDSTLAGRQIAHMVGRRLRADAKMASLYAMLGLASVRWLGGEPDQASGLKNRWGRTCDRIDLDAYFGDASLKQILLGCVQQPPVLPSDMCLSKLTTPRAMYTDASRELLQITE